MSETIVGAPARAGIAALASLGLAMFLSTLGASIANVALPALSREFGAELDAVQWVAVAYLGAMTVFVVLAGQAGDRFGLRRMLLAGLALFACASLLCALAEGLWSLVAARAVQGAAAAFLMALAMALVRQAAGKERVGRAMGLLGTMSAVGTATGPALGGWVLSVAAWQALFWTLVPISLAALAMVWIFLPTSGGAGKPIGRLPFAAASSGLMPHLVANALVGAVMMATLVIGPFYLGGVLKLPEVQIGLVMSVGPLISMLCGIPSGRLVDAWSARAVMRLGFAALTIGAFGLVLLPGPFGVAGYLVAIAFLTPGFQMFQAANNTEVMAQAEEARRGMISGLLSLSRNLGFVAGTLASGLAFSLFVQAEMEAAPPEAIADAMRLTFTTGGTALALSLAVALRRRA